MTRRLAGICERRALIVARLCPEDLERIVSVSPAPVSRFAPTRDPVEMVMQAFDLRSPVRALDMMEVYLVGRR